jgi:hypothetical protein
MRMFQRYFVQCQHSLSYWPLTLWWTKNFFLSFSLKFLEKVPLYEKITH